MTGGAPTIRNNQERSIRFVGQLAAGVAALALSTVQAAPVALELSLVMDVSGSISSAEYDLQRIGYKNAFLDASVQSRILSFAGEGGIAVNVVQFGTNAAEVIGWTKLDSLASILNFANSLGTLVRNGGIGTSTDVQDGMLLSRNAFATNNYEGKRKVMDVSGDGFQSTDPICSGLSPYNTPCAATQAERDAAADSGITINGLAIEGDMGANGVTTWYKTNVVTSDGFVITAKDFADFERAAVTKIGREINGELPEPASLALVGLGLIAACLARLKGHIACAALIDRR